MWISSSQKILLVDASTSSNYMDLLKIIFSLEQENNYAKEVFTLLQKF